MADATLTDVPDAAKPSSEALLEGSRRAAGRATTRR